MTPRFHDVLLAWVRSPARVAGVVVLLALVAAGGWYGLRAVRFQRGQAAARAALAEYDFPLAKEHLAGCLELRPADPETLLLAAQAARRDGLLNDSEEYLDRYRVAVPAGTPEAALQGVLVRVQRGEVKPLVASLLEYLEIRHPESEQILEALARGCVHVYRLDEAAFWTKQLLDKYPANPVGRLLDAQVSDTARKRERALDVLAKLVEDYPHFDKARLYHAGVLARLHRYEESAAEYREALRRQPADVGALLGLTRALVSLGRLDDAAPLVRRLEADHGDVSEALLECGRFAARQNRPEDAEPLLRRAARLAPNDHDVQLELAQVLRKLGKDDEAKRHLDRSQQIRDDMLHLEKAFQAMVKSPADAGPRYTAGQLCLRNGQVAEGLRWLYGALELAPGHKPTHQALAEHFEGVGDAKQAEYHRGKAR